MTTYSLEFSDLEEQEHVLRRFVLEECDTVEWTNYDGWGCLFLVIPKPSLPTTWPGFNAAMGAFREEYVGMEADNVEYAACAHQKRIFRHYRFRIQGSVREAVEKEGLVLAGPGLWDPVYRRDGTPVVSIIAHEPIALLHLTDEQKSSLAAQGLVLNKRID